MILHPAISIEEQVIVEQQRYVRAPAHVQMT